MSEKLNNLAKVTELGCGRLQDLKPVSLTLRLLFFVPPNIAPKLFITELSSGTGVHRREQMGHGQRSELFWIPMCARLGHTAASSQGALSTLELQLGDCAAFRPLLPG